MKIFVEINKEDFGRLLLLNKMLKDSNTSKDSFELSLEDKELIYKISSIIIKNTMNKAYKLESLSSDYINIFDINL